MSDDKVVRLFPPKPALAPPPPIPHRVAYVVAHQPWVDQMSEEKAEFDRLVAGGKTAAEAVAVIMNDRGDALKIAHSRYFEACALFWEIPEPAVKEETD